MKQYPSIPAEVLRQISVNVYDKIDGSNIRVEWKRKQGRKSGSFYKFGSRKQLLATDQGIIAKAPQLLEVFAEDLEKQLIDFLKIDRCICYFEFHGPNSFAGSHVLDDEHKLSLLDIEAYKKGMICQTDYLKICDRSSLDVPAYIGRHVITPDFESAVRNGEYGTFEGVVCKARTATDKHGKPLMFKIKNQSWIDEVKRVYAGNDRLLNELL